MVSGLSGGSSSACDYSSRNNHAYGGFSVVFRGNLPYTLVVLWCVAGRDLLHVLYCNYRPQHVSRLFSFTFLFRRGPFQCRPVAPNQRRPARLIARPMLRRLEPNSSYTCFFFLSLPEVTCLLPRKRPSTFWLPYSLSPVCRTDIRSHIYTLHRPPPSTINSSSRSNLETCCSRALPRESRPLR